MFVLNKTPQTVKEMMTEARWDASDTVHTSRKFYLENEVRYPAQILTGLLLIENKPRKNLEENRMSEKVRPCGKTKSTRAYNA